MAPGLDDHGFEAAAKRKRAPSLGALSNWEVSHRATRRDRATSPPLCRASGSSLGSFSGNAGRARRTRKKGPEPNGFWAKGWLRERQISRTWKFSKSLHSFPALPSSESPPCRRLRAADHYLAILAANPGMTRAALARQCGVSRAAVTQALRGTAPGQNP